MPRRYELKSPPSRPRSRALVITGLIAWLGLVGAGMLVVIDYASRPCEAASAPASWPAQSTIKPNANLPICLMFIHPHCPCTRASLREMERIMTRCHDKLDFRVVLVIPAGLPDGWEKTDLWDQAAACPGVELIRDPGGVEAAIFGARTSGQALLYSPSGELLFSGGITGGRGHDGDNIGRHAVISFVEKGRANREAAPVFGCALMNPDTMDCEVAQCQH